MSAIQISGPYKVGRAKVGMAYYRQNLHGGWWTVYDRGWSDHTAMVTQIAACQASAWDEMALVRCFPKVAWETCTALTILSKCGA